MITGHKHSQETKDKISRSLSGDKNGGWNGGVSKKQYYCKYCGSKISLWSMYRGSFRCRACAYKQKRKEKTIKDEIYHCLQCGDIIGHQSALYGRSLCKSCTHIGEQNSGYKDGRWLQRKSERDKDYKRARYKRWRIALIEKFGNKCARCGSVNNLQTHHIKPYRSYPELRYDLDNGMLLCIGCHWSEHRSKTEWQDR